LIGIHRTSPADGQIDANNPSETSILSEVDRCIFIYAQITWAALAAIAPADAVALGLIDTGLTRSARALGKVSESLDRIASAVFRPKGDQSKRNQIYSDTLVLPNDFAPIENESRAAFIAFSAAMNQAHTENRVCGLRVHSGEIVFPNLLSPPYKCGTAVVAFS
jgi:hypothetical protein